MAEESYEVRIAAAEGQRTAAAQAREQCYPSTPEWEHYNAKVNEWDALIADLRRQAAS